MKGSQKAPAKRRRSAGEGSTYEQGGRWRGRVTWTNPDGTQGRRYVSGATQAEAREKLDELRRELRLGTIGQPGAPTTVGDYVTSWLERHKSHVRPSTYRTDEGYVRCYIVPALGRIPLVKLTAADVERALGRFVSDGRPGTDRPVSAVTALHVRATLRTALTAAEKDGLVTRNAAKDARPPQMPHRDVTYLDGANVRRLLEATADDFLGPLWALAVSTGLRRGELLALRWTDVSNGTLTVRRSVGRTRDGGWAPGEVKSATSRRSIALPALAIDALTRQKARQDELIADAGATWTDAVGTIFTDEAGNPLLPERVSHGFADARGRAGIPPVRFHDLRHSAATMLLGAGVPMAVISEWLGHGDIGTTFRYYTAVTPRLRDDARAAMDRALLAG
jgi:integrase